MHCSVVTTHGESYVCHCTLQNSFLQPHLCSARRTYSTSASTIMSCYQCLRMYATQCYRHLHDNRMFLLFQSLLFMFLLLLLTLTSSSFILQAYLLLMRSFDFFLLPITSLSLQAYLPLMRSFGFIGSCVRLSSLFTTFFNVTIFHE